MLIDTLSLLLSLVLAINAPSGRSQSGWQQDDSFNTKLVNLTLSQIARTGPDAEIASFVSRYMELFWPKRDELERTTAPYLDAQDASKASAALDIFYRLRGYRMGGFGFNEDAWQREHSAFFTKLDSLIDTKQERLLLTKDASLLRNLALYLGVSRSSAAKATLLQLADNPEVAEQALICLGWHKDPNDMDDLFPFMLKGGREAASLPYVFRNSYGAAAATPYLRKAVAQAASPFTRLQAAFELIHIDDKTGVRYLFEVVKDRESLPNGRAQAGEIMNFATDYMGFRRDSRNMDELLEFLKAKL